MTSHGQTPRKRIHPVGLLIVGSLAVLGHTAVAQVPGSPPPGQRPPAGQSPTAQQPPAAQPQAPIAPLAATAEFDDETVAKFADAWTEVREIRDDYLGRIEAADDVETAQALQSEAQEAMTEAVTEAGVEVSDYNRIAAAMARDSELAERIVNMADSS